MAIDWGAILRSEDAMSKQSGGQGMFNPGATVQGQQVTASATSSRPRLDWNLSNWNMDGAGKWITQPVLTINGIDQRYNTPQEYINHLAYLKNQGATGEIDKFVQQFQSVVPAAGAAKTGQSQEVGGNGSYKSPPGPSGPGADPYAEFKAAFKQQFGRDIEQSQMDDNNWLLGLLDNHGDLFAKIPVQRLAGMPTSELGKLPDTELIKILRSQPQLMNGGFPTERLVKMAQSMGPAGRDFLMLEVIPHLRNSNGGTQATEIFNWLAANPNVGRNGTDPSAGAGAGNGQAGAGAGAGGAANGAGGAANGAGAGAGTGAGAGSGSGGAGAGAGGAGSADAKFLGRGLGEIFPGGGGAPDYSNMTEQERLFYLPFGGNSDAGISESAGNRMASSNVLRSMNFNPDTGNPFGNFVRTTADNMSDASLAKSVLDGSPDKAVSTANTVSGSLGAGRISPFVSRDEGMSFLGGVNDLQSQLGKPDSKLSQDQIGVAMRYQDANNAYDLYNSAQGMGLSPQLRGDKDLNNRVKNYLYEKYRNKGYQGGKEFLGDLLGR